MRYADAIATTEAIPIEGVRVPFLSLKMPIKSKTTAIAAMNLSFLQLSSSTNTGHVTDYVRQHESKRIFPPEATN